MKALIPAAGMATRLRPLTNDRPKCLLPIGERPLLGRALDALAGAGINEVVICTGYLAEQIRAYVTGNYPRMSVTFIHNDVYDSTNNIYSLYLMRQEAEGQEVLLLDSDIVFDPAILRRLLDSEEPNTLALNSHALGEEEIKVVIGTDGRVKEISKTCSISEAVGESIGIEKMSAGYTAALYREMEQMIEREGLSNVFYERAFERLIPQGHTFAVTDTTDLFAAELDTIEDFNDAKQKIPASLY